MNIAAGLLCTSFLLFVLTAARANQSATGDASGCATVLRALADSQRVKPDTKRKEVDKYFREEGLQFSDYVRYTYPGCEYIKLVAEFEAAPSRGAAPTSPDDTVKAVSKLFIESTAGDSTACAIAQRALADSHRLKPGMKRKEVEKYFKHDGGLQFPDNARYTYAACEHIKLEVKFEPAPSRGGALTSPDDTVREVSRLFIEYPVRD